MLCEEYELFLEIAQVIRRLELIILKGVLESRSDKLWAHFIIEVGKLHATLLQNPHVKEQERYIT